MHLQAFVQVFWSVQLDWGAGLCAAHQRKMDAGVHRRHGQLRPRISLGKLVLLQKLDAKQRCEGAWRNCVVSQNTMLHVIRGEGGPPQLRN